MAAPADQWPGFSSLAWVKRPHVAPDGPERGRKPGGVLTCEVRSQSTATPVMPASGTTARPNSKAKAPPSRQENRDRNDLADKSTALAEGRRCTPGSCEALNTDAEPTLQQPFLARVMNLMRRKLHKPV
jgi:hypothetical protein